MRTFVIIILTLFLATAFKSVEKSGYQLGDIATDFNLKNVDGKWVSMEDYPEAKGFIIAFTCNTCPFAKLYEQRIIDLHTEYASKGYPVIAINPNDPVKQPGDSFEEMKARAEDKNYPFPYLVDETQEIAKAYGATNTPHMYILRKESGKLRVNYIGAIDNNPREPKNVTKKYIREALNALLDGHEVPIKETKAIGCGIKWKSA